MQKTKRDKIKNTNPLMTAFDYDAQDLQDNQQGFMSHRQKTNLKWYLFWNTIWLTGGLILAGLWVIVFGSMVSYAWTSETSGIGMKIFVTGGFLFAGGMTLLALVGLHDLWRNVLGDLRVGQVDRFSGTLHKYEKRRHKEGTERWIVVQQTRFDVNYDQHKALNDDKPYHLYLAEKTRRILALEPAPLTYQNDEKDKNYGG